mmetsp:Transcript_77979/g.114148  ORF Transcript_77979/g.114148 Transcript_77979/m.114148 type:complete len:200 (+) Transcript_77979:381-980(+)
MAARNSSLDIGVLNIPHVPSVAPVCPSCDVAAVQSLSVTTLNPFSKAVRIVDSTQQLVRSPPSTTVLMLLSTSSCSKVVPGKASRPRLPRIVMSPSLGCMPSTKSAFQVPRVKKELSWHPLRMPWPLFGLSEPSAASVIGVCIILQPLALAASTIWILLASILVLSITPLTASWSLPPSAQNSFWYSIMTSAVDDGSIG